MPRRILFLDRDGTLIVEPPDGRVDRLDKLALVPGVLPALLRFKDAGYEFVVVSNQDRLGSAAFPRAPFDTADAAFRALFSSQGIDCRDVFYCAHTADDGCACRSP
jgi:imidazoleglycerol-phosphate dehydratase/histidinol-phosphatase